MISVLLVEDEPEVAELARDALLPGATSGLRERRMGNTEQARISLEMREATEQTGIGWAREQDRQQRIFPRTCRIDLIEVADHTRALGKEIGSKDRAIDAGRRFHRQNPLRRHPRPV